MFVDIPVPAANQRAFSERPRADIGGELEMLKKSYVSLFDRKESPGHGSPASSKGTLHLIIEVKKASVVI